MRLERTKAALMLALRSQSTQRPHLHLLESGIKTATLITHHSRVPARTPLDHELQDEACNETSYEDSSSIAAIPTSAGVCGGKVASIYEESSSTGALFDGSLHSNKSNRRQSIATQELELVRPPDGLIYSRKLQLPPAQELLCTRDQ